MGNYVVLPSGRVQFLHRDNVYFTKENRVSDFAIQVDPRIRMISRFARHALNIDVGGRYTGHRNETNLDTLGGYASAEGALYINHAHTLSFSLLSDYRHEEQLASFQQTAAHEYTPVWHKRAEIGITRDAGRLATTLGFSYNDWNFDNVESRDGAVIEQDFRDTTVYLADAAAKYKFSPGYFAKARIAGLRTLRDTASGKSGASWGMDVAVGVKGEASPRFHWDLMVGYGLRQFDDPDTVDAHAMLFKFDVQWFLAPRLTLKASGKRNFDFTDEAAGIMLTLFGVGADIEIRDDLVATLAGAYGFSEDLGKSDAGKDHVASLSAQLTYYHTKHLHLNAGYEFDYRASDLTGDDVGENTFRVGGKLLF